MKKLLLLFLISLIVSHIFGQFTFTPPPPPPPPMHQNIFMPSYDNPVYRCKIYLNDGTIVEGESGIYKRGDGDFYLKIKKQKYLPGETDSIFVNQCIGLPKGGHWLFETISGKLSVYNKYPINELTSNSFITKVKDQYTPYNKAHLLHEIEDHPEALSMYNKIRKKKNTSNLLAWGGIGVIVISFATLPSGGTDKEFSELPQSKFMIGGCIMVIAGLIVKHSSNDTYFDVVKKYNE